VSQSCVPLDADRIGMLREHPRLQKFMQGDIEWSEGLGLPINATHLAEEAIFVICNSGMKNTVARRIYDKVMVALNRGYRAGTVFGHKGKANAITEIWAHREYLYRDFLTRNAPEQQIEWCASLPWVGNITKYHLAKNLGVDCAKPDVHLQRLADLHVETVDALCQRLAQATGYRVATVDLILWRACAEGVINSRTGMLADV